MKKSNASKILAVALSAASTYGCLSGDARVSEQAKADVKAIQSAYAQSPFSETISAGVSLPMTTTELSNVVEGIKFKGNKKRYNDQNVDAYNLSCTFDPCAAMVIDNGVENKYVVAVFDNARTTLLSGDARKGSLDEVVDFKVSLGEGTPVARGMARFIVAAGNKDLYFLSLPQSRESAKAFSKTPDAAYAQMAANALRKAN